MEGRELRVNSSSLVELKTELYKKAEELKRAKALGSTIKPVKSNVKAKSVWSKRNAGVDKRAARDGKKLSMEEEDALVKSKRMLEKKAALYDKLMSGKVAMPVDDDNNDKGFLVDFFQKSYEKHRQEASTPSAKDDDNDCLGEPPPAETPDEEWVDFVDSLGRSRRCLRRDLPELQRLDRQLTGKKEPEAKADKETPTLLSEDMRNELRRQQWEEQERELAERDGPIHYEDLKFDEVRDMGVGYYQFSRDEEERQEQMAQLEQLRRQTIEQRNRREQLKEKRQAALETRLKKVRARQAQKLKEERGSEAADNVLEAEEEDGEVQEDSVERPEEEESRKTSPVSLEALRQKEAEHRAAIGCEWDHGKATPQGDSSTVTGREADREEEFAPPAVYSKKRSASAAFGYSTADLSVKAKVPNSFTALLKRTKQTHNVPVQEHSGKSSPGQCESEAGQANDNSENNPSKVLSSSEQSQTGGFNQCPSAGCTMPPYTYLPPQPPPFAGIPYPQLPNEFYTSAQAWPAPSGSPGSQQNTSLSWQMSTGCSGAAMATSWPVRTPNEYAPVPAVQPAAFPVIYPPGSVPPSFVPPVPSSLSQSSFPQPVPATAYTGQFPQSSWLPASQPKSNVSLYQAQLSSPGSHGAETKSTRTDCSISNIEEQIMSSNLSSHRSQEMSVQSSINQLLAECRSK